jgi:acyl-CoA synthetase (AMP-forming)/AMP-acid ligase II
VQRPQTLGDIVRIGAATYPDKPALRFGDRATSYGELDRISGRVASALAADGVKAGDRLSFLGKNCDIHFELLFGMVKIGAVMTPLNWRLSAGELAWIVRDAGVRLLFVDAEFLDLAEQVREQVAGLRIVAVDSAAANKGDGYLAWRDRPGLKPVSHVSNPEDVALQIYTSGTTGRPKGAMLPHRGVLAVRALPPEQQPEWNRWGEDDVSLVINPTFHISGTGFGLQTLCVGATGLIVREFDAGKVLDFIASEGLSKIFLVPASMQMLLRHPRARSVDYSRIRCMIYGASPMPVELLKEAMSVFRCGFVQMYGMTETSGTVVALEPEGHDINRPERLRSAGKPMPGVEVVILDEKGERLPPHKVGEITVRSPTTMLGYWNLPAETRAALSADNWMRTGDAGYLDEDGYLYLHDRVKDMIISGGENIYPAEVENAIFGHPDVAEVAVIGVPSEKWGEEVKAIVVPKPGHTPQPEDVIRWTRERIAHYKAPKSVDLIDVLPRNPSGKILRRELRERYWAGRARRVN